MKYLNLKNSFFLVLVALFSTLVSCDLDKTEATTNLFNHYYSIEPESLLDALDSGKVNVFSPITEEPPPIPPDQQIPVSWTQEDYLRIVNALFEFVWGETLSGWQLHNMDFALGCTKIDVGFQDGNFEFFKIVKTSGGESRIARIINIHPRSKIVFVTENEYSPRLVDWSSIDLGQAQLSASEILHIAENIGGQEKRLSVENACYISIWLSPDSASYGGWEVNYSRNDDRTSLFHIQIDPKTGDIY